ncbi:hypothetical protein GGS21DRAFT_466755 [Xylaria nigripes]|nr:hypothetical protein GGS21DRAFT_466755 [Xylaria nigripes]
MNTESEEERAFLPSDVPARKGNGRGKVWYFRLLVEIAMAVVIAALFARVMGDRAEEGRTPVPKCMFSWLPLLFCLIRFDLDGRTANGWDGMGWVLNSCHAVPRKIYTFRPDPTFVRDDMLRTETDTLTTLHNWLPLSSEARGYVQIPEHESYNILGDPYTVPLDRVRDGPAYMMAVFHQLHCLSYIIDHYQRAYAGYNLTEGVAHHSAHCFDYLRQSIMCSGDTNLEGHTDAGPGWGSKHLCVDYDALLDWANERAAMKWRTGLLPGTAIL